MSSNMYKFFVICILLYANVTFAGEVKDINNQDLKELIQQGVAVIDVRATSEWQQTGIVEGSHLIMFYDEQGKYDLNNWLTEVSRVANKDELVVLICHSGSRSKQLAKYLTNVAGYKDVYNVQRGIAHWIRKNNSVVAPN